MTSGGLQVLGGIDLKDSQGKVPSVDIFDRVGGRSPVSSSSGDIFDEVGGSVATETKSPEVRDWENKVQSSAIASVPKPALPRELQPTKPLPPYDWTRAIVGGLTDLATGSEMPTGEFNARPLGEPMAQGVKELATPGKRGTGALRVAATGAEAAAPIMGPAALETGAAIEAAPSLTHAAVRAVPMAAGLGAGYGASEAAGPIARKLGADPEQEELIKQLAFWAPSLTGAILQPKFGAAVSPEEVVVRGGVKVPVVGDVAAQVRIPRAQPPRPAGAVEEPIPNISPGDAAFAAARGRGQPAPPPVDPAIASMAAAKEAEIAAARQAAGIPTPPLPPPPTAPRIIDQPSAPPELQNGHLSQKVVDNFVSAVSALPEHVRAQAILEAHQTLAKVLLEGSQQGPMVGPSGKLLQVKNSADANQQAMALINDSLSAHEKVLAKASEEPKGGKAATEPTTPDVASAIVRARAARTKEAARVKAIADAASGMPAAKSPSGGGKPNLPETEKRATNPEAVDAAEQTFGNTQVNSRPEQEVSKAQESTPSRISESNLAGKEIASSKGDGSPEIVKPGETATKVSEPEHPNLQLGEHAEHVEMVPTESLDRFREFDRRSQPFGSDMDNLKEDIRKNGIKEPLVLKYGFIDRKASLDDGNHRLQAAKELGVREVPVRVKIGLKTDADLGKPVAGYEGDLPVSANLKPSAIGLKARPVGGLISGGHETAEKGNKGTISRLARDEAGTLDIGKIGETVGTFYKQDVSKALEKGGSGLREVPALFVRTFYPRIEESNPVGRALGVAAPADAVDALMKVQGDRAKAMAEFDLVLKSVEKTFDRLPEEARIDFIDRIQTGKKQSNSNLDDLAEAFKKITDAQRQEEQDAANLGRSKKDQIELSKKQNYFHNWWDTRPGKEPEEDESERIERQFMPRRPLEGTEGYNKRQSYTLKSGIEAGGEPVTTNPVRILRHRIEDGMKFITARRAWYETQELGLRTFVRKGAPRPAGFDKIDDKIAKVYFPAESGEGNIRAGEWYVEANTARLLNNMLSVDKVRANALGRGLMWLKNASTALELGLSPFHAVFETLEAVSSQMSLGMQKAYNQGIRQGKTSELAQGIKDIVTSPAAPITLAREGAAIPAYIEARARLGKIGLTEYGHVISGEQPHGILEALKQFNEVRKEKSVQRLIKQYPDIDQLIDDMFQGGLVIGQHRDYQVKAFGKTAAEAWSEGNPIGAVWRAIPTITQGVMYPLFNWYIPSLKYSLFFKMMSEAASEHARELEDGSLTRATLARRVADSVENRFGELNFDNLFLNRTTKSALQFLFRSITYKLGTLREFAGAGGGQAREFATWAEDAAGLLSGGGGRREKTPSEGGPAKEEQEQGKTFGEKALPRLDSRAAWVTSLMILTAMVGTIAAKLLSRKYPWEWVEEDEKKGKSLAAALLIETTHPRTGEIDSRGKPVRASLPTYWKDVEHMVADPARYVLSSLSSIVSKGVDTAENRDYFGNYVYNPNAGLGTKAKQIGKYNFPMPFVASNFLRGQAQGESKTAWLSAFGFPKAPSDLDFTPAEKLARDVIKAHEAPATPEELEAWREKHEAFVQGKLPYSQAKAFMKHARESMLQRQLKNSAVSYSDARKIYEAANPDEKKSLNHIMREKRTRLMRERRGAEVRAAEAR